MKLLELRLIRFSNENTSSHCCLGHQLALDLTTIWCSDLPVS
jgi:hypothetical protein